MFNLFKCVKIYPLLYNETINNECSICLEELTDKSIILLSGCNHKFHSACIRVWFRNVETPECPLCKTDQTTLNKRLNKRLNNRLSNI